MSADSASASAPPQQNLRVFWDGRRFLVWHTRHAYELRCGHRIVGTTIGALPTNKRQTCEHGMPIELMFEEALLVAEEGIAEVVNATGLGPHTQKTAEAATSTSGEEKPPWPPATGWITIDADCPAWTADPSLTPLSPSQLRLAAGGRLLHAQVYHALWARGFYITSGTAFGADYLCYPGDPMRHHAHLVVHVARPGRPMGFVERACLARLANSVKKTAVLAECAEGAEVTFTAADAPTIPLPPRHAAFLAAHAAAAAAGTAPELPAAIDGSTSGVAPTAIPRDGREKAEIALQAPIQGATAVPIPRERVRRPRAPWEVQEGQQRGDNKRRADEVDDDAGGDDAGEAGDASHYDEGA